jgi:hypothetical protein
MKLASSICRPRWGRIAGLGDLHLAAGDGDVGGVLRDRDGRLIW